MKHTKAPWFPVNYAGYWMLQTKDEYSSKDDLLNEEHSPDAEANAKLAACAPQLLKALKGLESWSAHLPPAANKEILKAKSVIKKATE